MKLQVLVDNNTFIDMYYLGEPAVSYYIEDEDTKILFDTGYSNIFIDNAKKMNIDLNNIDKIVLSHGHNDHTRGLNYLDLNDKKDLICHEDALNYKELDNLSIGIELNKKQLEEKYNLNIINKPSLCLYTIAVSSSTKSFTNLLFIFCCPITFLGSKSLHEGISPK